MNYQPRYEQSHALVIGINAYLYANPLTFAVADAQSVSNALMEECGFEREKVTTLLDSTATREAIMRHFFAYELLGDNDRLIIFFAGHGTTASGRKGEVGYLVPCGGRIDDKSTLIPWSELIRGAEIIPAKHILFVMDACYSGLAIQRNLGFGERRFVSDMLQRGSRQVITAGKADETVSDGGGPNGGNSIFTGHLLEGLRSKAMNSEGVLTGSALMHYVYQKVGNDPNSDQTPHYGHIDGDGDFILKTPDDVHLSGVTKSDYLVHPVPERPEPKTDVASAQIAPKFAERNGYADPNSESFGKNEWSDKLALIFVKAGKYEVSAPPCWLSIVTEPVSNQRIDINLLSLAKLLPTHEAKKDKPYAGFRMPGEVLTTSQAVVLYESEHRQASTNREMWRRFLRIDKSGAMEYCNGGGIAAFHHKVEPSCGLKIITYVQLIGTIWSYLHTMKSVMDVLAYEAGLRVLVNLIGTKDSVLVQFSSKAGKDKKHWVDPLSMDGMFSCGPETVKCRDANLQFPFQLVLGSFGEKEIQQVIVNCAEQLGLAYNHQSATPRCFNYGTYDFPWNQFNPSKA